ncbi:MAG: short-chain dehydrogenase [Gammaproteobacteria bacterium]|nr:short-chain dehydrogenase [Gammaproteobacteria bacterium]MBK81031.1 short-chain dehydrogenase [Gammaproteobacteria bacterium]|tara:strand:+ start:94 stop:861 length:768 start_codon:yes stop_codon:yes gene_type:complete
MTRRTALITGASAGLGAEFARQLSARDFDLVLVARRRDRLDALAEEFAGGTGRAATVLTADLADPEAPQRLAEALAERGIAVDYLVNNAGAAGPDLLDDRDWSAQRRYFELMMVSVAHLCHLFVPGMRERGWGRVVNVASVAGRVARGGDTNYGPAKAYLVALSEGLAATLKGTGVNVTALCPGFTHTEFHDVGGLQDMKAGTPGFLWYDADVVVREGIEAVERGRPVMVSGRLYRMLDPLMQSVWTRPLFRVSR